MGAFVEMSMDYFTRRNPLFTPRCGFCYEDERAGRQVEKQIIHGTVRARFEFHSHQAAPGGDAETGSRSPRGGELSSQVLK